MGTILQAFADRTADETGDEHVDDAALRRTRAARSDAMVAAALTALRIPANRSVDELLVDLRDRDPGFRRSVHDAFASGCTSLQWRDVPLHRKVDVFRMHYRVATDDRGLRRAVVTALVRADRSNVHVDA